MHDGRRGKASLPSLEDIALKKRLPLRTTRPFRVVIEEAIVTFLPTPVQS